MCFIFWQDSKKKLILLQNLERKLIKEKDKILHESNIFSQACKQDIQ